MLISFAATNHRSLCERVELSFVAESRPTAPDRTLIHVPGFDLDLVPALGLIGANGSGKSNVLDVLSYIRRAVRASQSEWGPNVRPPRAPFERQTGPNEEPSVYEISFAIGEGVFEYEFHVGPSSIQYEKLFVAPAGPRSWTRLFERWTRSGGRVEFKFGRRLRGARGAASDATRANSLFLSSAAQNNHEQLTGVWRWLTAGIRAASAHDRDQRGNYTAASYLQGDADYRERLRAFISGADLGIRDIDVREVPMSDDEIDTLKRVLAAVDPERSVPESEDFALPRASLHHGGDAGAIELVEESAGTQAWFEWAAPIIDTLDSGTALAADEVDAHLNNHLASEIVRLFQLPRTNHAGAQLIFNVQDPAVVSMAALGRDQVWVVEKDERGFTHATPVSDFANTRRWEPGRAYQHGRFGGLPVIDDDALASAVTKESDAKGSDG